MLQPTLKKRIHGRRAAASEGGITLPLADVWIPKPGGPRVAVEEWEGQSEMRGAGERIRYTKPTVHVTVDRVKLLPVATASVNEAVGMAIAVSSKPPHVGRAGASATGLWWQVRKHLRRALWGLQERGRVSQGRVSQGRGRERVLAHALFQDPLGHLLLLVGHGGLAVVFGRDVL